MSGWTDLGLAIATGIPLSVLVWAARWPDDAEPPEDDEQSPADR